MSHALIIVAVDCHKRGRQDIEKAVAHEMEPFDENGEWFKQGSRWDWWVIGGRYTKRLLGKDVIQRKNLNPYKLIEERAKAAEEAWDASMKEEPAMRGLMYGITQSTKDEYIKARLVAPFFCGYFLKSRQWHENGRMGWFGSKTQSECQARGRDKGKCLVKDEATGATIVGWNEEEEKWNASYWKRFIEPLEPDTWLAVVDFHV